jgi:hypothetical protein
MNVWCLCSSVAGTFLDFGTEEYSRVIFLGTEKYKITEKYTLFSCSGSYTKVAQQVALGEREALGRPNNSLVLHPIFKMGENYTVHPSSNSTKVLPSSGTPLGAPNSRLQLLDSDKFCYDFM